jgi:hypothetical protein
MFDRETMEQRRTKSERPREAGVRVLVAEDDPGLREVIVPGASRGRQIM